jgi:signal transduction histidine kinase
MESPERPPESEATAAGSTLEQDTAGARILLIDADPEMRAYMQRLLAARFMVEAHGDSRAALAAARWHRPDLVLCSTLIGGLDCVSALRELRANPVTRTLPVIVTAARDTEAAMVAGLEAGADEYLVRPLTSFELLSRVSARIAQWRLRARLASVEEQRRMAVKLHDSLGQTMVSVDHAVAELASFAEARPAEVPAAVQRLHTLTRVALAEMRVILDELRPGTPGHQRLGELIEHLAEFVRTHLPLDVLLETRDLDPEPLPEDMRHAYYRIAQETLSNVVQHAQATRVEIRVSMTGDQVELRIRDDGRGFDTEARPLGPGLRSMWDRAASVGAELTITSAPGQGTEVVLRCVRD